MYCIPFLSSNSNHTRTYIFSHMHLQARTHTHTHTHKLIYALLSHFIIFMSNTSLPVLFFSVLLNSVYIPFIIFILSSFISFFLYLFRTFLLSYFLVALSLSLSLTLSLCPVPTYDIFPSHAHSSACLALSLSSSHGLFDFTTWCNNLRFRGGLGGQSSPPLTPIPSSFSIILYWSVYHSSTT